MIDITMTQRADGTDIARHGAFEASSRNGASMKLARMMVAEGVEDQPWQVIWDDGRVRFSGASFHHLALWTATEGDVGRPRFTPFVAFERFAGADSDQTPPIAATAACQDGVGALAGMVAFPKPSTGAGGAMVGLAATNEGNGT